MGFTHFNEKGMAKMVDVSLKDSTSRTAIAKGRVVMKKETLNQIVQGKMKKGDVLSVAQVAGIMGAKNTSQMIPMCHNIFISGADIEFELGEDYIDIKSIVKTYGQTGIEMEALTSVSMAALTIYDMCKAIDKDIVIENIRLINKTGGKSGEYIREEI